MDIAELLKDFRSIKLPERKRNWITGLTNHLQTHGAIPTVEASKLRVLAKRYSKQFKELHASRERALRSNALRKMGMTKTEEAARIEKRKKEQEEMSADLGF